MTGTKHAAARLLLLDDFGGATAQPVPIDKTRLDEVLASIGPRVSVLVPDHLDDSGETIKVELNFSRMSDFEPLSILERCAATSAHVATLRTLQDVTRGATDLPSAIHSIQQAGLPQETAAALVARVQGPSAPQRSVPNDDILKSVAMPESTPASEAVDAYIERMDIPRQEVAGAPHRAAAAAAASELADRLGRQLDAILHHPDVASLESAWRGCQLLLLRTDTHADHAVQTHLISCSRDDMAGATHDALTALADLGDGVDAVITGFRFGPHAEDLALLRAAAGAAERHYALLVAGASADLLGGSFTRRPPSLRAHLEDSPALIEWRALRQADLAGNVALVVPDILGRHRYGASTVPVADLAYEEADHPLWVSGSWGAGSLMLHAAAHTGWPLEITGMTDGAIERLPVAEVDQGGRVRHLCTGALWSDEEVSDLARAGLSVIATRDSQNKAHLIAAVTLAEPEPVPDPAAMSEARAHVSLAYRLFGNRVARRIDRIQNLFSAGMSSDDAERMMIEGLGVLFTQVGEVRAEASPPPDEPDARELLVQILPSFRIMGREVNLMLSVRLP